MGGDIIVLLIIVSAVSLALLKIRKDKKNGVKCSGCNHSDSCPSNPKNTY